MEVTAADGEFRFKPSIEGIPAGMLLEWFDGPQVHVAADNTLFWPYVDGIEVTDVTRRSSPYRPVTFRDRNWNGIYALYPSYCQMQFLAAYKNCKGVYFSAVDDRHTLKQVDWERIGDGAVRLSLLTFCGDLDADGAWKRVLSQIHVDPAKICMVGDNPYEDCELPKQYGVGSFITLKR